MHGCMPACVRNNNITAPRKMKTKLRFRSGTSARGSETGFTMVELLTVLAIVVILVGMTIGIISIAQEKAADSQCETQREFIEMGLKRYYEEYGEYPVPKNNEGDTTDGAKVLYQALTGDGDNFLGGDSASNGKVDDDEEDIFRFLDPQNDNQGLIRKDGSDFVLSDPFGSAWQYVVYDKENPTNTHNSTYDLWSYGNDKGHKEENSAMWIKNW